MSPNPLLHSGSCAGCKKSLPKSEFMRCTVCKATYDLECANVSSSRFYSFYAAGSNRTSTWKCPECVSKQPKKGNSDTPVRQAVPDPSKQKTDTRRSSPDYENLNVTQRVKRNTIPLNVKDVSDEERTDCDRFELLLKEMRAVRQEVSMMNTIITDLHATIKEQNKRIDGLEAKVDILESRMNEEKSTDLRGLEETILQLKSDIQDRDQQMLSNDVEVTNLPEQSNENPTHVFLTVAKKLGLNLEERDIVRVERAGPVRGAAEGAPSRPRPLVARLARRSARDALLQAARVRRGATTEGTGLPGAGGRFYVNERLTRSNRQLFQKIREVAKRLKWRYVWTRDGKVFVRREQGGTVHRLCSDMDISRVFGVDTVGSGSAGTQ